MVSAHHRGSTASQCFNSTSIIINSATSPPSFHVQRVGCSHVSRFRVLDIVPRHTPFPDDLSSLNPALAWLEQLSSVRFTAILATELGFDSDIHDISYMSHHGRKCNISNDREHMVAVQDDMMNSLSDLQIYVRIRRQQKRWHERHDSIGHETESHLQKCLRAIQ